MTADSYHKTIEPVAETPEMARIGLLVAYNCAMPLSGLLPLESTCRSMTEHIKKKLEQEIQVLEHELNHELPKELKKAVAMGDLSENAEYHMAKQRQEFVRARLGQLKQRMADLSMINMANIPKTGLPSVRPCWFSTPPRTRRSSTSW